MSQYGIAHIDETEDNPLGLLLDLADIGAHTLPEKYRPNLKALAQETIRQAKEAAWDEGHEDGAWNTHNTLAIERLIKQRITNPYRKQP